MKRAIRLRMFFDDFYLFYLNIMSKEIESHILTLFDVKQFLGSGAYGHVWKVVQKHTNKEYALKKVFDAFQNEVDAQRTYREVTVLHQLDHPNIVSLHSVLKSRNGKDLYMVFELVETDLHSIIGQSVLGGTHLKFIAYQLAKVLKYLHSAQLLHRDLKSSNILINSNCQIKLCDFGLVRSLTYEEDTQLVLSEDVATRWYRSPEMLLGCKSYGPPTDMWSMGCVLAELVIGEPLFPGSSSLDQFQKILEFTGTPSKETFQNLGVDMGNSFISELKIKKRPLKDYFKDIDKDIKEIILKLLEFDPAKRITALEVLELPCVQEFRGRSREDVCKRFIAIDLDDNKRLQIQDYKAQIHRDIERRYPQLNKITPMPRIYRAHHSLDSKTHQEPFQKKSQNSAFKSHYSTSFFHKESVDSQHDNLIHKYFKKEQRSRFGFNVSNVNKENMNTTVGAAGCVENEAGNTKIFKRKARNVVWKKAPV